MPNSQRSFKIVLCLIIGLIINCSLTKEEKIDKLFKKYSGSQPGAAFMVIKDSVPVLTKTYGLADIEINIPVESKTNFRLASFTKQFTTMCIMMLAEQGKLNYDQTLTDIFPDFPDYGKKITIRQIMNHTSGLIDYESLIPDTATIQVSDKDVLDMMIAQDSTWFTSGTKYKYSNSGYAVLAMAVKKVSGLAFAEFLKQNIFIPLEMNNSVAYENGISTVPNRAFGYKDEDGKLISKDQSLTSAVLGDGGIYSSIEELIKWDQALYTEKLVKSSTLKEAFTSGKLDNGEETGYGFGWRIDSYKGHNRVHHTGQTCGFTTVIQRYPNDRFTIIILTNRNNPMLMPLANKIADLLLIVNE